MLVSSSQNYKEVVQLVLRAEKLSSERISQGKFQKNKGFGFVPSQSSKKNRSFESSRNSFRSRTNLVSFPQTVPSPQPSGLGTLPPSFAFRGRTTPDKCPCCRQFHSGACNAPQLCFQCGKIGHVKRFCLMLSSTGLVEQSLKQPRASVQGFGRSTMRSSSSLRPVTGSSSGIQGVQ